MDKTRIELLIATCLYLMPVDIYLSTLILDMPSNHMYMIPTICGAALRGADGYRNNQVHSVYLYLLPVGLHGPLRLESDLNLKIANLTLKIANLAMEIANLTLEIANLHQK